MAIKLARRNVIFFVLKVHQNINELDAISLSNNVDDVFTECHTYISNPFPYSVVVKLVHNHSGTILMWLCVIGRGGG